MAQCMLTPYGGAPIAARVSGIVLDPKESRLETLPLEDQHLLMTGCVIYVARGHEDDVGKLLRLPKGRATVGTSIRCDLSLKDPRVSRQHVELAISQEGIGIKDLDSTNGTRLHGNRIEKAIVQPGTRLVLGGTTLALLPMSARGNIEPADTDRYGDLLGDSIPMRKLYTVLQRLEATDAPVLIQGETGTGKELVAKSIHRNSQRSNAPFVVLDCGSIPTELVESEVFGHVKGSFTGALSDRPGAFQSAHGGTIFLDEVGELTYRSTAQTSARLRVRSSQARGNVDLSKGGCTSCGRYLQRSKNIGQRGQVS